MKSPTSISLVKLKRYPKMRRHLEGKRVRIYSGEHRMWWRNHGHGYTHSQSDVGIFDFKVAWDISHHAGPEKKIAYVLVEPEPQITDEQIREWSLNHGIICAYPSTIRAAFEDARSMKPL